MLKSTTNYYIKIRQIYYIIIMDSPEHANKKRHKRVEDTNMAKVENMAKVDKCG